MDYSIEQGLRIVYDIWLHTGNGWLVVSGFNATLTAKVISWWSVKHMTVSWLSHTSTNTTFPSKATDYFSHMLLQR